MGLFSKTLPSERRTAAVPKGSRIYAIGDIHGRADLLAVLLATIVKDRESAGRDCSLIFLGDYVDRGPESRQVIERLLAPPPGFKVCYLRGNHDHVPLSFLGDPTRYRFWREYGGEETLLSYGVAPPRSDDEKELREASDRFRQALPAHHFAFLNALELSVQIGDYYFVHAGVRPGIPLDRQIAEDQMWIRDDFLSSSKPFGATIVHGHTPTEKPVLAAHRIGVDTGAYITGRLTAAVLEGTECRFLQT